MNTQEKNQKLARRKQRVRKSVVGTTERPRLNVFRSRAHIYAQIIDDLRGHTVAAASTLDESLRESVKSTGGIEGAKAVGKLIAERAKAAKVSTVVFDRGGGYIMGGSKPWPMPLVKADCSFREPYVWEAAIPVQW